MCQTHRASAHGNQMGVTTLISFVALTTSLAVSIDPQQHDDSLAALARESGSGHTVCHLECPRDDWLNRSEARDDTTPPASVSSGGLARAAVPARRDLRRGGHQLLPLLRSRGTGRAVPVRRAGQETRVAAPERTAFCWHGYLPNVGPGQRYGFRVHGPWAPERGAPLQPGEAAPRSVRESDRR